MINLKRIISGIICFVDHYSTGKLRFESVRPFLFFTWAGGPPGGRGQKVTNDESECEEVAIPHKVDDNFLTGPY